MIEQSLTSTVENTKLTNWKNAPTIRELKQDLEDAKTSHDNQVAKIDGWLDNLNVTGKAKVNTTKGNSQIVPKFILQNPQKKERELILYSAKS